MISLFYGIRFKLSVLTFLLVAIVTTTSSMIAMNVMDRFVLGELIKRGLSMGRSAATASGYSLLSDDNLALDNLTAKLKEFREDVLFVAIVDTTGIIKAHSKIGKAGRKFSIVDGEVVVIAKDKSTMKRIKRDGASYFEFITPIIFAEKKLGDVYIGIDTNTLTISQSQARRKIILTSLSVLVIGVVGTYFLSTFITTPLKSLTEGVSQLSSGKYTDEIPVASKDELGQLTKNFNQMAKTITEQKNTLKEGAIELENALISTVRVLSAAIEARDPYTFGHSTRVARLSLLLGEKMDLSDEQLRDLELACLFHDVGKIRTPDNILHKDDSLTEQEHLKLKRHPEDGADILKLADSLQKHIPAVLYHHEWYNSNGYPEGLKGNEIPLFASIISIVDAYDAMTTSRPYRSAISKEEAIKELKKFKGKQFDPHIADLFIDVLEVYENSEA